MNEEDEEFQRIERESGWRKRQIVQHQEPMSITAMKQAIDALQWANEEINGWMNDAYGYDPEDHPKIMEAITALRQAIAEQDHIVDANKKVEPPPQRKPLSDEQIKQIELSLRQYNSRDTYDLSLNDFARAIEAAHGIKGEA